MNDFVVHIEKFKILKDHIKYPKIIELTVQIIHIPNKYIVFIHLYKINYIKS